MCLNKLIVQHFPNSSPKQDELTSAFEFALRITLKLYSLSSKTNAVRKMNSVIGFLFPLEST